MFDVIIIGGGIIGCAVLEKLSQFNINALLLEKGEDVAIGTTRANSGIIHAGFDAHPGSMMARFNVIGNKMFPSLCERLKVDYFNTGALVLAEKDGKEELQSLFDRGIKNGVKDLEIIDKARIKELEPNVADNIEYALFAPTSGVVSPFAVTVAMAEWAINNGQKIELLSEVIAINRIDNIFEVKTEKNSFKASVIINCAGAHSIDINRMLDAEEFETHYKRGDYYLFDASENGLVNHTCFKLPTPEGKGVLVTPNADGTLLAGPTSIPVNSGDDTAVSAEGLAKIRSAVPGMIKQLNFSKCIRVFAGVRSIVGDDFVIEESKKVPRLIITAGICSPGLSSAPAIAEYIVSELVSKHLNLEKSTRPIVENSRHTVTEKLDFSEWERLAENDHHYSTIVCRCEKITQGEILEVLRSPLKPRSLDAIKRRVRVGMGRCQGGFCSSKLISLISDECDISINEVTKSGPGSEIVISYTKEEL